MKLLITLCGIMVVASIAMFFFGCRKVDTSHGNFTHGVSVRFGETSVSIDAQDSVLVDVVRWIRSSEPCWKVSFSTYMPKLVVRNEQFSLNFLENSAVLSFKPEPSKSQWIQVIREYSPKELSFLEPLRAKIQQTKQADAGKRSSPETAF